MASQNDTDRDHGAGPAGQQPRLGLHGITKQFPGVRANDAIELEILPGEIHALLGENGAGKSTLVKIIYGVLHPDAGSIFWEGRRVEMTSPHVARALGIGMVFQHFSLFEAMTVLENVALGLEEKTSLPELASRIREVSASYGLPLDPYRPVHTLSVGERQRIEILRCLLQNPKLLIMDEPTSVLTPQEAERLFDTLRRLAHEGCSILYISHKLEEVRSLCERATILRLGKVVATCDPREETARSLAQLMVGTQLKPPSRRGGSRVGAIKLQVEQLSVAPADAHGVPLREASFSVRAGEIFGIAGVAGNGQDALLAALSGEVLASNEASIRLDGTAIGRMGPTRRRDRGLCYIPEERLGHGAVADLSLKENAALTAWRRKRLVWHGLLRIGETVTLARAIVQRFDVRTAGIDARAGSLSGGNLQKFIVGREVLQEPGVLIAAQPTWGVDAGAAAAIHQALIDMTERGCAIVLVSQDLDEILALSDRVAVINAGRMSGTLVTAEARIEEIGLLMGGLHDLPRDEAA